MLRSDFNSIFHSEHIRFAQCGLRFFARRAKNDVRNPLKNYMKQSGAPQGIPQSLIRFANFGSFGMTCNSKNLTYYSIRCGMKIPRYLFTSL